MPITRKRKAQSPEPNKQTLSASSQKSMREYGRVTKSQKTDQSVKRRLTVEKATAAAASEAPRTITRSLGAPKQTEQQECIVNSDASQPKDEGNRVSRKRQRDQESDTPQHKRFKNALPLSPAETPTKGACNLLDRLNIAPIPTHLARTPRKDTAAYESPPLTPRSLRDLQDTPDENCLPVDLQDFVRLFSSFLTGTSLFYAHNGANARLELRSLVQLVTRSFKKRAVTESEIRKMLHIIDEADATFILVDNGEGSICLEQGEHAAPGQFNQPALNNQFQKKLNRQWETWTAASPQNRQDTAGFLKQIPLVAITRSEVAPADGAGPSKGQRRLDVLKAGAIQARADEKTAQKSAVAAEAKTLTAVSSRGSSLLDRILAKQQLNMLRGSGPTQEETDRRVALDRIEEVCLVLDLLAGGRPRASFSTQMMVSHLQNSLRNPIAKDEAQRCIELMASEVTPGFVSMIQAGHVKGVVITKGGRPSNMELRQRLERARV